MWPNSQDSCSARNQLPPDPVGFTARLLEILSFQNAAVGYLVGNEKRVVCELTSEGAILDPLIAAAGRFDAVNGEPLWSRSDAVDYSATPRLFVC